MGRGNACVRGKYEGLYYVDWNNFSNQYQDGDGKFFIDYNLQHRGWNNALETFINDFTTKYTSFVECEKWISREEKAILENELFYIVTEDCEWSMAIKLIQKDQDYYQRGNYENLQAGLYKKYLEGMKKCLFNQFETLGIYGGAWTSGTIKRNEQVSELIH